MKVDFDAIDKMVAGGQMDGMVKWYEQIYFLTVSAWREYLKAGICKKEDASEAKMLCRREVQKIVDGVEFEIKLLDSIADRYKETEIARSEYRKNRTLENADKMSAAFDGLEVRHEG